MAIVSGPSGWREYLQTAIRLSDLVEKSILASDCFRAVAPSDHALLRSGHSPERKVGIMLPHSQQKKERPEGRSKRFECSVFMLVSV
jgi:hypothetical protein